MGGSEGQHPVPAVPRWRKWIVCWVTRSSSTSSRNIGFLPLTLCPVKIAAVNVDFLLNNSLRITQEPRLILFLSPCT